MIQKSKEKDKAREYVKRFDIKAASLGTQLQNLSGGNQQKVYLSKWMDTNPEILILDEPTRGIDINTKKEIYHFIHSLTEQRYFGRRDFFRTGRDYRLIAPSDCDAFRQHHG